MGYYSDLSKITIEEYKTVLTETDLLPSWKILGEQINERLSIIQEQGISNLQELKETLKSKENVQDFSIKSELPTDYLIVLRRVINGYHPRPNAFKNFLNISPEIVEKLKNAGFRNTLKLYPHILAPDARKELCEKIDISNVELEKIAALTDLSRIRWVNHTFAYVLYRCGFRIARQVAEFNPKELYEMVLELNKKEEIYKANIGLRDMKLVVEEAQKLTCEMELV